MVVAQPAASAGVASTAPLVLSQAQFRQRVEAFNRDDEELYAQFVPDAAAWEFLRERAAVRLSRPGHHADLRISLVDVPETHQANARRAS